MAIPPSPRVNDASSAVEAFELKQSGRKALYPPTEKIQVIDLTKPSMEETLSRVGSLPPDTVVFYASILRDGAGKTSILKRFGEQKA